MSLRELERRTGISRAYLSRIENGSLVGLGGWTRRFEEVFGVKFKIAVLLVEDES
jgi:transcriptional regulator with XRE-family HTH domain